MLRTAARRFLVAMDEMGKLVSGQGHVPAVHVQPGSSLVARLGGRAEVAELLSEYGGGDVADRHV